MRAMVLERHAKVDSSPLVLRDLPDPRPGPGEVRVKVSVCAVCRTDLHVVEGDLWRDVPGGKLPIIPGHQAVGVVDQLGEGCRRLREGQRVGIAWLRGTDGTCRFCTSGRENLCPQSRYTGYHADGGYAEYAVVPEHFAYELSRARATGGKPAGAGEIKGDDDVAISPLLCGGIIGYRALQRAAVPERGRLLLVGYGSSAHMVLPLALHRGHTVYVITRGEEHVAAARRDGAAWAGQDFAGLPEPVDSAILFAPVGSLVPPTLAALDRGGTLSLAGIHYTGGIPALDYDRHLFHEKQLRSTTANTRADGVALLAEAAAARLRPPTTPYPLAEANRALSDVKHSRIDGTAVLVVEES